MARCGTCEHWHQIPKTRKGRCHANAYRNVKHQRDHCEHYERKVIRVVELKPDQRAG